MRVLTGAAFVAALIVMWVCSVAVRDAHHGLRRIGHHDGPIVMATSNLYFALADMDTQVTNALLTGDRGDLGITRNGAQRNYDRRRGEVAGYLQQTGMIAGDNAAVGTELRGVLVSLGRYEQLAGQALQAARAPAPAGPPATEVGQVPAEALDLYRNATRVMHDELLPAAKRLTDRSVALVGSHHRTAQSATAAAVAYVAVLGLLLLTILGTLQIFLARRHRRVFNPALLAGTLATVVLLLTALSTLSHSMSTLDAVKRDAFASIVVLHQARAVSYDMNGDKSRYLLDPSFKQKYQDDFTAKSADLADVTVGHRMDDYQPALAQALYAYQTSGQQPVFGGYFGTALRNLTFAGEGDAARRTLAAYAQYQFTDREIRALVANGKRAEAIRLAISYSPDGSNGLFEAYDKELVAFTDINVHAFTTLVARGDHELRPWDWIPEAVLIATALLVLIGVRPRLAEYRG